MADFQRSNFPPEQESIRAKCFNRAGKFVEFTESAVEQSIPAHFERRVAEQRDRLAVRYKDQQLSYGDLNRIANRVARALLSRSGSEGAPIALLLGHDGSMIASLIGVMKAGKICVPLDSTNPLARTRNVVEDSQAALILTDSVHATAAHQLTNASSQIINIDELDSGLADGDIGTKVSPEALAFILYTSGSTAQPKGVPQTHRNALHSALGYINYLHIEPEDRLTLLGSCSGGQGMKIMISALVAGAALYPWNISEDGLVNLAKWLSTEYITIYISGAAVFRSFAATLSGEEKFPALRIVRVGNEPVRQSDVELYKKYFSRDCIFVNWFALTEAGNLACYYIDQQTRITDEIIPIGYPLDDTQILVLDDAGQQLGSLETGEIAIRGRFLSPGYWREPDLTRNKFLDHGDGERTFLSGDLGFVRADGLLYHTGRKDFQVKIRGNRLEIGEVESALLALDGIREAVVVAENRENDIRLIAYLVTNRPAAATAGALRRALAEKLPQHMIPATFVMLDAMPVTANGKVDRRALPQPEQRRSDSGVPPQTSIEATLAGIWAEVIGIGQVGIHDNFFELGGHSLAAIQIVSRIIKQFEIAIPLQLFFQSPTVAEMAALISASRRKKLDERELHRILTELESVSEEEAQRMVGEALMKSARKPQL